MFVTKKKWHFWTVVLEKTFECLLDCKEIKPVNPEGNQPWIFKTDCWSWSYNTLATCCEELTHFKDTDAGKDWRQEEKGTTEDEMIGWHHRLNRREFEQAPGGGEGQGSLAYCSQWGQEWDMTERLNKNKCLCAPPQLKPTLNVMVLGGWAFGRWLGHEGGALMNGISVLMKETPESCFSLLTCEDAVNQEKGPHQTLNLPAPWSRTFQPPKLWEINVWSSQTTQSMAFCYRNPNRLSHLYGPTLISVHD